MTKSTNKKGATVLEATPGKIFHSLIDGAFLSSTIILGKGDSESNYEEVDPSAAIPPEEPSDG